MPSITASYKKPFSNAASSTSASCHKLNDTTISTFLLPDTERHCFRHLHIAGYSPTPHSKSSSKQRRESAHSRIRVGERLACSPHTKAIRVQSPAGSFRTFACENRTGRCRWSEGFLGHLSFPPPFQSGAASYLYKSPSSALKTSMLRAVQIFSLTHSYLRDKQVAYHEGKRNWRDMRRAPAQITPLTRVSQWVERSQVGPQWLSGWKYINWGRSGPVARAIQSGDARKKFVDAHSPRPEGNRGGVGVVWLAGGLTTRQVCHGPGSIPGSAILILASHGFPNSRQANARMVPHCRRWSVPSVFMLLRATCIVSKDLAVNDTSYTNHKERFTVVRIQNLKLFDHITNWDMACFCLYLFIAAEKERVYNERI
ncbi:hypothetical protein PR048_000655 [Dryococelus australis]|uniref:Uncharacterized protein n=1 Tax=Dryococelus australis TaxID=614101 RepID=A0ABQ9IGG9_9NEOP|nr:hypothetical protein PR048_000655 [Dryococelus australis]